MIKQIYLSHKKLSKANLKTMNAEDYQKITDWMKFVKWFTNEGDKIVNLDEFSINHKTVNLYWWTYRGVDELRILFFFIILQYELVISFNWNQIEDLMRFKSSVCSDKFIWYLPWLLSGPCNKKNIEEGKIVLCSTTSRFIKARKWCNFWIKLEYLQLVLLHILHF